MTAVQMSSLELYVPDHDLRQGNISFTVNNSGQIRSCFYARLTYASSLFYTSQTESLNSELELWPGPELVPN